MSPPISAGAASWELVSETSPVRAAPRLSGLGAPLTVGNFLPVSFFTSALASVETPPTSAPCVFSKLTGILLAASKAVFLQMLKHL